MSLPKEPRQLMINLMYLVLTALLALNVSAEILNAFLTMNRSIVESSEVVEQSNRRVLASINQQADAYAQFKPLSEKAERAVALSNAFYEYVEQLKAEIIEPPGSHISRTFYPDIIIVINVIELSIFYDSLRFFIVISSQVFCTYQISEFW